MNYWHYCSCGRNAPEENKPKIHVLLTALAGEWRQMCPDCGDPLTLRVEYCKISDLNAENEASWGDDHSLICPYCGEKNDAADWRPDDDEWDCGECGNTFSIEADYCVTWTTRRM